MVRIPFSPKLRCAVAGFSLLLWSCAAGKKASNDNPESLHVSVSVDKSAVKLGQEINVSVEGVPEGWSGELTVNTLRHFSFHSQRYTLRATLQNGFKTKGQSDLFILLLDHNGHEIPVADLGHFPMTVSNTAVSVMPEGDNVPAAGGIGHLRVDAGPSQHWAVSGVPDWIKITSPEEGSGSARIDYKVAENTSYQPRSALVTIGDATFQIAQTPSGSATPRDQLTATQRDGTTPGQNLPTATVALDKTMLKLGQDLQIRLDQLPEGWSGEITVNALRHFPVHTNLYNLRANVQNGFNTNGRSDVFILLTDRNGRELPIQNLGHFAVTVAPTTVSVSPDGNNVGAGGGSGVIQVSAGAEDRWSVNGAPGWIKIVSGRSGAGMGTITYDVAANASSDQRSAEFTIGDATFQVTQPRATSNQLAGQAGKQAPAEGRGAPSVKVAIDKTSVKVGQDIHFDIDGTPMGWSGEIVINGMRHFPIRYPSYTLKAIVQNGFNTSGVTEVVVMLADRQQHEIPLANLGHFQITVVPTAVTIFKDNVNVSSEGGPGQVQVVTASSYNWSVKGVPDWMQIISGDKGTGKGSVDYKVAENLTNERRSAALTIGDATLLVSQSRPVNLVLPFRDSFKSGATPVMVWDAPRGEGAASVEQPTRWVLDEQPGQHSAQYVTSQAPGGGNSLVIERPVPDPRAWASQLYLRGVKTEQGGTYRVSVWLKARTPGTVTITFGQMTAPYENCGLSKIVKVSENWTEFVVPFHVTGKACAGGNGRISFEVARVAGKLWISKFAMTPGKSNSETDRAQR